jgi:type IV secretion system protein VirB9
MNNTIGNSIIITTAMFLSGCAGVMSSSDGLPDAQHYVKAKNMTAVETKVVREYVPVPVPGQLMPVPEKAETNNKVFRTKKAAVQYANQKAIQYPDQNDFFNSMMTYSYMPGAVYTIYTAPLKITDVVLEKGEKLISQAAGDTLRWQIAQTYSGEGKNLEQHILVKPSKPNIENSVILTTNKRTYHLLFKSTSTDSYMVSVKWNYPKAMVKTFSSDYSSDAISGDSPLGDSCPAFDISRMKFNYTWKMLQGDKPNWVPQQVFSVGGKTYIKFSSTFMKNNQLMPMLEVADSMDKNTYATMTNWRFHCGYIIVDSLITKARLVAGVDSNSSKVIIQITKK